MALAFAVARSAWRLALFFLYTGLEVTAAQWTYSILTEARGFDVRVAGLELKLVSTELAGPKGHPHNLAWGDDDGQTRYLTAQTGLYRLRLDIGGARP